MRRSLFCGVNNYTDPEDDRLRDVVTGVLEDFDIPNTLRAALSLQKDVSRVVVINDRTVRSLRHHDRLSGGDHGYRASRPSRFASCSTTDSSSDSGLRGRICRAAARS
ncbi:MAG TPA: hypothetical protein VF912_21925 [Anaeromyxobacter sp.]